MSIEPAYRPTLLAIRVADDGGRPGTAPARAAAAGGAETAAGDAGASRTGEAGSAGDGSRLGAGAREGHGLVGMRERAPALGGWFSAGPRPDGGFLVHAGLPTE
ncbi:hypothetical protein [Bailinhaonella thermotolerans]|uniref:hypothetical protein n=1 Tax=Bailinhaonella thermotolerans TaxID=1070861 RepID=UPI0011C39145|nr:hypothetical protein [Bailinhaonella thermotolerans]